MNAQVHLSEEQVNLAEEADVAVAVVGTAGEFALIDLRDGGRAEFNAKLLETKAVAKPGFHWCGVLAFKDGQPEARCESDLDSIYTMMHAGLEFARIVAGRLTQERDGDTVEWLRRMHSLPDSRLEN